MYNIKLFRSHYCYCLMVPTFVTFPVVEQSYRALQFNLYSVGECAGNSMDWMYVCEQ